VLSHNVISQPSFHYTREWLSEFRQRGQPTARVVVSANRAEWPPQRKMTESEIQMVAEENQIDVVKEISALSELQGVKPFERLSG
jgi:hypothetical protein